MPTIVWSNLEMSVEALKIYYYSPELIVNIDI